MKLQFSLRSYFIGVAIVALFCCWLGLPTIWGTTSSTYAGIDFKPCGLTRLCLIREPRWFWIGFQTDPTNPYPYALAWNRDTRWIQVQFPPEKNS